VWIVQIRTIIRSSRHSGKHYAPVFQILYIVQRKPYDSEKTLCICSLGAWEGKMIIKLREEGMHAYPLLSSQPALYFTDFSLYKI
jgi:hypothetical protein